MKPSFAAIFLVLWSCSPPAEPTVGPVDAGTRSTNGASADGGSISDAGGISDFSVPEPDVRPAPDTSSRPDLGAEAYSFEMPAATGSYAVDFDLSVEGSGSGAVGAISISNGSGTVVLDGRAAPIGTYQRQEWTEFGYTLYQGIAVDQGRWWILWFYCQGDQLTDVYYQGTTGPRLATVSATGTCSDVGSGATVDVDFPAHTLAVDPLLEDFSVTGPNIDIRRGEPGTFSQGGRSFDVYAFGHVDCTAECGPDGWHELHAILRDETNGEVCFAIFYLYEDMRYVQVAYAFSLPSLSDPLVGSVRIDGASWTRQ